MKKYLIAAIMGAAVGLFSNQAMAADDYDALLAHIDYLEQEQAVWGELSGLVNNGNFDALSDAAQVGADYASAMAPPPPYDDGSVDMAVTDALDGMVMASGSLDAAMQARLDAVTAAEAGFSFEANGQYDDAVAAFQAATYDDPMGFGIVAMDLWSLGDAVDNANYWLANWPEDPGGMMP